MGLHANISQQDQSVNIAIAGKLRATELRQLRAIVAHFLRRGCNSFVLDLTQVAPLSSAAVTALDKLVGTHSLPHRPARPGQHVDQRAHLPALRVHMARATVGL